MPELGPPQSLNKERQSAESARRAGLTNVIIAIGLAMLGVALLIGFFDPSRGTALLVSGGVLAGFAWLTVTVIRGMAALPRRGRACVMQLAAGALVVLAAAPFVVPFFSGVVAELVGFGMGAVAFIALLLIARRLTARLAIAVSIFAIIVATWVVGLLALYAYESEWQGLDIRDVSGIDQGDGFGIGLAIAFYTAMAPFLGFVVGVLSQIGKRPAAAVSP